MVVFVVNQVNHMHDEPQADLGKVGGVNQPHVFFQRLNYLQDTDNITKCKR